MGTRWRLESSNPLSLVLNLSETGPYPQYGWDLRPRKRSQSVSWNSPREYSWDPPNPIIQGIWGFQSISRILSPPARLGTPLFSEVVPERVSQSRSWNTQQYWGYIWETAFGLFWNLGHASLLYWVHVNKHKSKLHASTQSWSLAFQVYLVQVLHNCACQDTMQKTEPVKDCA